MKPYPSTIRSFDIDKYLDQQLAQQKEAQRQDTPKDLAAKASAGRVEQPFTFRAWAIRLNDRIECWLDRTDWPRIDIWLGNVGGFVLTGVVLYFGYVLVDAWLQGHFNLGGN